MEEQSPKYEETTFPPLAHDICYNNHDIDYDMEIKNDINKERDSVNKTVYVLVKYFPPEEDEKLKYQEDDMDELIRISFELPKFESFDNNDRSAKVFFHRKKLWVPYSEKYHKMTLWKTEIFDDADEMYKYIRMFIKEKIQSGLYELDTSFNEVYGCNWREEDEDE